MSPEQQAQRIRELVADGMSQHHAAVHVALGLDDVLHPGERLNKMMVALQGTIVQAQVLQQMIESGLNDWRTSLQVPDTRSRIIM